MRVEAVALLSGIGGGHGGYWEDEAELLLVRRHLRPTADDGNLADDGICVRETPGFAGVAVEVWSDISNVEEPRVTAAGRAVSVTSPT